MGRICQTGALLQRDPPCQVYQFAQLIQDGTQGAGIICHALHNSGQGEQPHTAIESLAASQAWRATMRFKSSNKANWASFASLSKRPHRVSGLLVI
jgi:hypothetical protein